jgi:hypothetical protein
MSLRTLFMFCVTSSLPAVCVCSVQYGCFLYLCFVLRQHFLQYVCAVSNMAVFCIYVLYYVSTSRSMCVQCPIWLFSVFPWLHAFPECSSGIFWMIFKWFRLPLLLLVSLLFPYSVIRLFPPPPAAYRGTQWIISIVMTKSTQLWCYPCLFCVSS